MNFNPLRTFALAGLVIGTAARGLALGPLPGVTPQEIFLAADWNDDGREDLALVDRPTGLIRLGLVSADGSVSWGDPFSSGLKDVTGAAPVRIAGSPPELALASPTFNRVNLVHPGDGGFREVFPTGVQPGVVAGVGNLLWVASDGNGGPQPHALERIGPGGTGFETIFSDRRERATRQLSSSPIQAGQAPLVWQLETGGAETRLRVLGAGGPIPVELLSAQVTGSADRFAVGFRPGDTLASVVLFGPLESALTVRATAGSSPVFGLGAPLTTALPGPAGQVLWAGADVLALATDGSAAWQLKFNGTGALELAGSLLPADGSRFSGGRLDGEGLQLLHRPAAGGFSTGLTRYQRNGAAWTPTGTTALPDLHPLLGTANVFLFDGEPFTDPNAQLLRSFALGAWTSDLRLGEDSSVGVETFSSAGLGTPGRQALPGLTPGAGFGLSNQEQPHVSLFSFSPPFTTALPAPEPTPGPGSFVSPIQVTFAVPTGATVLFRRAPTDPWTTYSAPVSVPATATLWWFQREGSVQSPVRMGTFTINTPPAALDSDGDGVSDAVEAALGLDPVTSGPDSDGDGATDAQEVAAQTSPTDPLSRPEPGSVAEPALAFSLDPRGVDGSSSPPDEVRTAAAGTVLTAWLPSGTTRATVVQSHAPPTPTSASEVRKDWGFLVASTPSIFPLVPPAGPRNPDASNLLRGRELLALLPLPAGSGFASGDLGTRTLSAESTLATAVFEARLEALLQARLDRAPDSLTLVPARPGEGSRSPLTLGDLAALRAGGPGVAGVDLEALLSDALDDTASLAWAPVRAFARAVFRASSLDREAGAEALPLPFDILRRFVRGREPDAAVVASLRLNPAEINAAQALVTAPKPAPARPIVNLVGVVAGGGDDGCPRVRRSTDGVAFALGGPLAPAVAGAGLDTRIELIAYADALVPCEAPALEPIIFSVLPPDPVPPNDANGNQIPDSWELALAGSAGGALGDPDADQVSNRAELEAGTDPFDGASKPAAPVATQVLIPPTGGSVLAGRQFTLRVLADGALPLAFQWERNGVALPGRTAPELVIASVTPGDAGQYRVRVSGAGGAVTSAPVSLTVLQANRPPTFAPLPLVTNVPEVASWTLQLTATDPDEGQSVSLALLAAPEGLTLDAAVNRLRWQPTEGQGPSTNRVLVVATDNATPPAATTNELTIVVLEVNRPPEWTPPSRSTVAEGTELRMPVTPTDADLPPQSLALSLVSAPAGAQLASGQLAWTPSEAQAPSTNRVSIRISDGVVTVTNEFLVVATEVNLAPELAPVTDRVLLAGEALGFNLIATDADLPPQHLAYALVSGPSGMVVNPDSGAVLWSVPANAASGTYPVTVQVSDDGEPSRLAERTFRVTVNPSNRPPLRVRFSMAGARLRLEWDSLGGDRFRIERQATLGTSPWESIWTGTATGATTVADVELPLGAGFFRLVRIE